MTDHADRFVLAACLAGGLVVIADLVGVTAARWAELELARQPQTVCGLTDGHRVCVDLPVRL